ncbi:hypothetical protein SteCoe_1714 [Stentor coeruleus]|uniref:ADP-ribosylglycohydrolase n=1 Tax=Stentor coeruleus TaxID=5963 RepID=A0A1R2D1B9_9CILI|nr:hypothetical protein SteCoe_1714 [Stentor coeruleus]
MISIMDDDIEYQRLNCALGCVIGAFIGDALGSALEFQTCVTQNMLISALLMDGGIFGNGPGQVTDDSELAMCILTALSETAPKFNPDLIGKYYKDWIISKPFDIGRTTALALRPLMNVTDNFWSCASESARIHNKDSQSNGSFMRSSPLAVFCRKLTFAELKEVVIDDVCMTHSNKIVQDTECLYIRFISYLIQNPKDKDNAIIDLFNCLNEVDNENTRKWIQDAFSSQPMNTNDQMGWVKIAFDYAFKQIRKHEINFTQAISEILSLGGDTDTNAAIVGAMIGAYVGYDNLNDDWKKKVEGFDSMSMRGIQREGEFLNQTLVKKKVQNIFANSPDYLIR